MNYHDMIIKTNVGLSMGMKQESVKYTDVASATQASFESGLSCLFSFPPIYNRITSINSI